MLGNIGAPLLALSRLGLSTIDTQDSQGAQDLYFLSCRLQATGKTPHTGHAGAHFLVMILILNLCFRPTTLSSSFTKVSQSVKTRQTAMVIHVGSCCISCVGLSIVFLLSLSSNYRQYEGGVLRLSTEKSGKSHTSDTICGLLRLGPRA